ncbi:MAG: O-antigen ligase family protein [Patescibacteria group bacterium]|nr:O-antigen ligase family protein [Patescibacteria group bacterium]
MKKHSGLLAWIDLNILKVLTVIFIYLIPLYPKFPLQMLRDTYIAIRLEDIFMLVFLGVFLVQLLRKKVTINRMFLVLFGAYWSALFLSFFWGAFVQNTILFDYLGFLHAARRVEYMCIFFIAAAMIRSKEDFIFYMRHVLIAALLVFLYGFGQKFIGLPAIQTMNKEFAKGITLFLTPEARVSSTFAGHYDLAAYFILLAPMMLGYFLFRKSKWIFLVFVLGVLILIMTASRSSYGAYLVGVFGLLIFLRNWKLFIVVLAITAIFTLTNDTMTERFAQTFRVKQLFINEQTGEVFVPQEITTEELPAGTSFVPVAGKKSDAEIASSEALLRKQFLNEIRAQATIEGKVLSPEEELKLLAQRFTTFTPVVGVTADISFATRLQASWPRAIEAYRKNPFLGSGPSSLGEATDGSVLRWLGELGLLGSSLFVAILAALAFTIIQSARNAGKPEQALLYGFIFGLVALGINGTYIDVFEASKVAYTLWLLAGLYMGALPYLSKK